MKGQLLGEENRAAVILRQLLDGSIRVIPYMRIDGKRVVPRLEFTIDLVAALPPAVAAPLRQAAGDDAEGEPVAMLKRTLTVNAFDEPQLVKHARVIVQRRLEGKTYKEIAKELDLTKDHIQNCARITKLMEAAGLPEPYRRLTENPDYVPQWCSKHWLKAGERKGGGKRRRASCRQGFGDAVDGFGFGRQISWPEVACRFWASWTMAARSCPNFSAMRRRVA
ncbi:MAG: hypothetical protein FJ275_08545 [Planctomycetes bacterium]|nr:hypothetical protein [Planctomycetota bacterium]